MSDWPTIGYKHGGTIHSSSSACCAFEAHLYIGGSFAAGSVWPAANRAIYIPFIVQETVTAYQMAFEVFTQSGNCDVGIYDENAVRLVSSGSTGVGAAGKQAINITDTVLNPALYFMAMCVDNTTASIGVSTVVLAEGLRVYGIQQQAVGAVTLPNPATFANPATAYMPGLAVALKSTV